LDFCYDPRQDVDDVLTLKMIRHLDRQHQTKSHQCHLWLSCHSRFARTYYNVFRGRQQHSLSWLTN